MPKKTFTASVLTAADMNTYLMNQAVITCTSGTRPSGPVEGMTIYETDTDVYGTYNGTAWEYNLGGVWRAYTPTLTGINLGNGSVVARYTRIGDTIKGTITFSAGSTTTYSAGNTAFSMPVAYNASIGALDVIGYGWVDNGSGATRRLLTASAFGGGGGSFNFAYEGGTLTNTGPLTMGTATRITFSFTYEQA